MLASRARSMALAESDRSRPCLLTSADLPLLRAPVLHLPNITEVHGADRFEGLGEYMLRTLSLLGPNQYAVLPLQFRTQALELLAYFRSLQLTTVADEHVLFVPARADAGFVRALLEPEVLARLRRLPVSRLEPFLATASARELATRLQLEMDMAPELAQRLNDKAQARRYFEARGMKTPGGRLLRRDEGCFVERVCAELERLFVSHQTCALTLPSSFSGVGIRRVRSIAEAVRVLEREPGDLLVEPWLAGVTASPSFVLYLSDDERDDRVIASTEQLLQDDGCQGPRHVGNVVPARHELSRVIEEATDTLRELGARGIVGVDLIARGEELLITEVNARQTGAIFGALTALRAAGRPTRCVVHNNVPVAPGTTLAQYVAQLGERAYDPATQRGVLVISHGSMPAGKVMVVAIDCEL